MYPLYWDGVLNETNITHYYELTIIIIIKVPLIIYDYINHIDQYLTCFKYFFIHRNNLT